MHSFRVSLVCGVLNSFLISRIEHECSMYLGEREGGDSVFCETSRLKLALLTSAQFVLFIIKPKQFLGMLSFIN